MDEYPTLLDIRGHAVAAWHQYPTPITVIVVSLIVFGASIGVILAEIGG